MIPASFQTISHHARSNVLTLITFLTTALLLMLMGAMLLVGLYLDHRNALERTRVELQAQVHAFSGAVDRAFISADHLLHGVRNELEALDPAGLDSLRPLMLRKLIAAQDVAGLRVFDPVGREHLRVGQVLDAETTAPQWLQQAMTDRSESALGPGATGPGVSLALRRHVEGMDGALLALLDQASIDEQLAYSADRAGHQLVLLDAHDQVLMHFPARLPVSMYDLNALLGPAVAAEDLFSLHGTRMLETAQQIGVMRQLSQQPVRALVLVDKVQVLSDWLLRAALSVLAFIMVLLLVALYLYHWSRQRRRERDAINGLYLLYQAIEQVPNGVAVTGLDRRLLYANRAFLDSSPQPVEQQLGQVPAQLSPMYLGSEAQSELSQQLEQGDTWQGEVAITADNRTRHEKVVVTPVQNMEGDYSSCFLICADITERRLAQTALQESEARFRALAEDLAEKNRELEHLSITDSLTGLVNRGKLDSLLRHEIERARRYASACSVILFDIDHFKRVNDQFGHDRGDQVLRSIAAALRSATRQTDWPGRWGGEEFLILCPQTDLAGAAKLAEGLRQRIQALDMGLNAAVTCSFGVAYLRDSDQPHTLVKRADEALYRAKSRGRNQVVLESPARVPLPAVR